MKRILTIAVLIVAIVLSVGLILGDSEKRERENLIASLGDTNGLTLPIDKKNTEISVLLCGDLDNYGDKLYIKKLEEITGLKLNIISASLSNAKEKSRVMIATKQLPDISQIFLEKYELEELASNDVIVPVSDHFDIMPNLKELVIRNNAEDSSQKIMRDFSSFDDKLYIVPTYGIKRPVNHFFLYRKDIFDKHGIAAWTNKEEFAECLRKLKKLYPDSEPFVSKMQYRIIKILAAQWGMDSIQWGTNSYVDRYYDPETDEWSFALTSAPMRDLLMFFRQLNDEGLIEREFFTSSQTNWESKLLSKNECFVTFDWIDRADIYSERMKKTLPGYDLQPGLPVGPSGQYEAMHLFGNQGIFIKNNKNSEVSMKLADFLISEAGGRLATLGIENETYSETDGKVKYKGISDEEPLTIAKLEGKYGLFTQALTLRYDPQCVYFSYTPRTAIAEEMAISKNLSREHAPMLDIKSREDQKIYDELISILQFEFDKFTSSFIFGSEPADYLWDGWVKKANELGAEKLEELIDKYSVK